MLVGRGAERARIDAILADARGGRGCALVVRGDPGIGKTALLGYAAEQAAGFRVLRATGVEAESELAFSGLHELLAPALGALDELPKPQAAALREALALAPPGDRDLFAVSVATLGLLVEAAADAPVLCLVDDAQWIDEASADVLRFAARRVEAESIVVLVAAREGDPKTFEAPSLPSLELAGLHREAARLLLGELPPADAERVLELSRGNPLALLELPRDAAGAPDAEPLPVGQAVSRAFRGKLDALAPDARLALLTVAAAGIGEASTVVEALAELGLRRAALESSERAGLIRIGDGELSFAHPLVRSAVYESADPVDRRRVHGALAETLRRAGRDERYPWHLAAAATEADEEVAAALARVAESAGSRGSAAAMSRAYERAARLTPAGDRRAERLLLAADAGSEAGGLARVQRLCRDALAETDDVELRAEIHKTLENALYWAGDLRSAHRIKLEVAAELAPVSPVKSAHMRARATASLGHMLRGSEAVEVGRDALALLADPSLDPRVPVMLAQALARCAETDEARRLLAPVTALVEEAGVHELAGNAADVLVLLDELDAAEALLGPSLRLWRARGGFSALAAYLAEEARIRGARGQLLTAYASATESFDLAEQLRDEPLQCAMSATELAVAVAALARENEVERRARDALDLAARCGSKLLEARTRAALGAFELARGRPKDAITELERVRDAVRGGGYRHPAFVQFSPELVEAYVHAGRHGDAATELAILETEARAAGTAWALAASCRARGIVRAEPLAFEDAMAHHARSPRPLEQARTQLAYGEQLRRSHERVLAREQLRRALATFESAGAAAWAERTRHELRASGETLRSPSTQREELTPQELRVALAVAAGATNKEAAAQLFLSTKTIEFHLRNAYRKLGVRSRVQLARRLEA